MNTQQVVNSHHRRPGRPSRLRRLLCLGLLAMLLTGCDSPPGAEVVGAGYEVKENNQSAWASIVEHGDVTILDPLPFNVWTDMLDDGLVTTNNAGIAELRNLDLNPDCTGLFVFKNSGVKLGSCTKSATGSWNCVVGAAVSSSCNVGLASPSTDVTLNSWVSLISLDNGALSIVTVLEGSAKVVPVTQLDYRYEPSGENGFTLSFATRVLDESQAVGLGSGESTFTASDDYLTMLPPSIAGMARSRLDAHDFQFLINELLPLYPLLPGYIESISFHAELESLYFPATLSTTFLLEGLADTALNEALQEVVLQGVEWMNLQEIFSTDQPVSLAFRFPNREGLLVDMPYDPDYATAVSKESGLEQTLVYLLVPAGDSELLSFAEHLIEALSNYYIEISLEEIAPEILLEKVSGAAEAGIPVLWLTRQ